VVLLHSAGLPGAGTILVGSAGAFFGTVIGDYLKYRLREAFLLETTPNGGK